jgi:hypothetical protein
MRVVADQSTANIIQAEKTPDVGDFRPFNGKFACPIPEMVAVEVTGSSYVLPVDGGDVMSLAMAQMLVQYPMYSNIVFNPFLTAADVADMDLTATFPGAPPEITRAFVGRGIGPLPVGIAPNVMGVLPRNNKIAPFRPGMLISGTIDIGPLTGGAGADEFMVWWKLYAFSTSDDVTSSYGATSGQNDPALRNIIEVDPDQAGFEVHLSHDDGLTYTQMNRLEPTDFFTFGTLLRIAFRNTNNTNRRYIAAYSILF